jgi:hypothetical protein
MQLETDFIIVELDPQTFHPLIQAEFEGLEDYWWVLDSGASKTVMDISMSSLYTNEELEPVMATGLGKEVVSTASGIIPSLQLGGYRFKQHKVALVDLKHINEEYARFSEKKIIGLIGCDFLYSYQAILDFQNKKIAFEVPD